MLRSTGLISLLLCNVPEDDRDWWMDEHQVTHVNSHCVRACLLKLCIDVSGCINVQGRLLVV